MARNLAPHVGSLPRPDDLIELLMKQDRGDTYDTEKSGVPNAITVFKEMRDAGIPVRPAIRLDSGVLLAQGLQFRQVLNEAGMGALNIMATDGLLPETVVLEGHPWFIGVQYHPEYKSRPFAPHPLFASFIAAAKAQSRLV